ncbi:hypothetical protein MKD33_17805, partial [Chromobacterium piscinae]
MLLLTWA